MHEEVAVSKPNRRRCQEPKPHILVRTALPPTGLHRKSRKQRQLERAIAVKRAIRSQK